MTIRLHPTLIPLFAFFIFTGNISTYAQIFISILVHEMGHLSLAKYVGVQVRSCVLMPYGGEITLYGQHKIRRKHRFLIACGGPLATSLLLVIAYTLPFSWANDLITIQLVLLSINLLPVLPLDGGQAISAWIEKKGQIFEARRALIIHSIVFYSLVIFVFSFSYKESIPFLILAFYLLISNLFSYRYLKYEKALLQLT